MQQQNRPPQAQTQESGTGFSSDRLVEHLVSWFTQNGGVLSSDVKIDYSDSHGYHVRALRPLSSPNVASCPLRLTLSSLNLNSDEEGVLHLDSPLAQCQGKIPDHVLSYLLLIEQRNKGLESPWHAYIDCLPGAETMTTPLWFDDSDFAFLTGTALAPAARERKEDMLNQFQHAMTVLKQLDITLPGEVNFQSFLWSATIFTSRAFISTHILPGRETVPLLFPVVDILNHSVSAKVEWDFQPHTTFTLKLLDGSTFREGDELFNNYAPKQNDELLLGYGFCLEDNPMEQFALKLAFPPMLRDLAQQMGMFDPKNVPFGMSSSFLEQDPNNDQPFLRAKGHPFGRYENNVPFFQGIPPYIVHFFFIQALLALEIDVHDINVHKPDIRITVQVLALLHQALEQRCASLPLTVAAPPSTPKQRYVVIYRNGQAKIIHSVRLELKTAIDNLRAAARPQAALQTPGLLSVDEALNLLHIASPSTGARVAQALTNHFGTEAGNDDLKWAILLFVFAALLITSEIDADPKALSFVSSLFAAHHLPTLEDGIEDADTYAFLDENLGDFVKLSSATNSGDALSPTDVLDDLGLTFVNQSEDSLTDTTFIKGKPENLGVRLVMWAMNVAQREVIPVLEEGGMKKCLLVRPLKEGGDVGLDEKWIYEAE